MIRPIVILGSSDVVQRPFFFFQNDTSLFDQTQIDILHASGRKTGLLEYNRRSGTIERVQVDRKVWPPKVIEAMQDERKVWTKGLAYAEARRRQLVDRVTHFGTRRQLDDKIVATEIFVAMANNDFGRAHIFGNIFEPAS